MQDVGRIATGGPAVIAGVRGILRSTESLQVFPNLATRKARRNESETSGAIGTPGLPTFEALWAPSRLIMLGTGLQSEELLDSSITACIFITGFPDSVIRLIPPLFRLHSV